MNILVIGSGGREHALALKISQSAACDALFCVPGNPGMAKLGECHSVDIMDNDAIVSFAQEKDIGLVVVGPENPLANGIVDALSAAGIKAFGPGKEAAQFEGSKLFARNFMKKHGLPSPEYAEFTDVEEAVAYIEEKGAPIVIKADGLAAGKGVSVCHSVDDAVSFTRECLEDNKFGDASARVVIEECMVGEEASYHVFVDGKTFKPMVYSQDHKPIFEDDKGPNTGGMGTYSPAPILDGFEDELENNIMKPFLKGIAADGIDYKGVLYVGLMKTDQGLKIVEFNCRFGDPETQVIIPRMQSDIVDVMLAVVNGKLGDVDLQWNDDHVVCVVAASAGYPGSYEKGKVITGIDDTESVWVIHAGTKQDGDAVVTSGGRVLGIVGKGGSLREAVDTAYEKLKVVSFEGMYYRKDIAKKELDRQEG